VLETSSNVLVVGVILGKVKVVIRKIYPFS
jgi:hypothetical protein